MDKRDGLSRRNFLKTGGLVGAGVFLPIGRSRAGVALKSLIPPEDIIPGRSYWFHSTCAECSAGCGVKVRVREGNAVKIEGNENHPINHGGLCVRAQSVLQALYSPARIRTPLRQEADGLEPASWEDIGKTLTARLRETANSQRKKLVVVTGQVTGGMLEMLQRNTGDLARSGFLIHEPLDYVSVSDANKLCFRIDAVPTYDFASARTIVSFGADLFGVTPIKRRRDQSAHPIRIAPVADRRQRGRQVFGAARRRDAACACYRVIDAFGWGAAAEAVETMATRARTVQR